MALPANMISMVSFGTSRQTPITVEIVPRAKFPYFRVHGLKVSESTTPAEKPVDLSE